MDHFKEIEEECPCILVADSQEEIDITTHCDLTSRSRKEQANILQPTSSSTNRSEVQLIQKDYSHERTSSRDQLPSEHKHSNVPCVLNVDLSAQRNLQTINDQGISLSQEDLFSHMPQNNNNILTSTPMVNSVVSSVSSYNASKKQVEHLTPLEEPVSTPTDTFQCLQLSGDIRGKDTSSSDDLVSPTSTSIKPESSTSVTENLEYNSLKLTNNEEENPERIPLQEHECSVIQTSREESAGDQMNDSHMKIGVNKCEIQTNLPQWQKNLDEDQEKSSSLESIGTLSRTTSNNSTGEVKGTLNGSNEPFLHQWQSQQNGSDELFEADSSNNENTGSIGTCSLEVSSCYTNLHRKGLVLPEMSDDILCHRPKNEPRSERVKDIVWSETKTLGWSNYNLSFTEGSEIKKVPPVVASAADTTKETEEQGVTNNDIMILSQEDCFRLYLTQSQSSQVQHKTQRQTQLPFVDVQQQPLQQQSSDEQSNNNIQEPSNNMPEAAADKNNPELTKTNISNDSTQSSPGCEVVVCSDSVENLAGKITLEFAVNRQAIPAHTTDDMALLSTELTESGHEPFHFSPPMVLLRPTRTITPPPCLETSSETMVQSQTANLNEPSALNPMPEFETILPEVAPTRLSLSVPVPCEESDEEEDVSSQEFTFSLKKPNFIPEPERPNLVTKPVRSVFTNVRERFQSVCIRPVDEEFNPFEFTEFTPRSNEVDKPGGNNEMEPFKGTRKNIRIITRTTCTVEREIITTYTDKNGKVVHSEAKHEFDEPSHTTSVTESEVADEIETNLENPKEHLSTRKRLRSETDLDPTSKDLQKGKPKRSKKKNKDTSVIVPSERSPFSLRKKSLFQEKIEMACDGSHVVSNGSNVLGDGSHVLALWFDKHYYPGTVKNKIQESRKYCVVFDDGDISNIWEQDILVVDYLPLGQPVMFCDENSDCYDNGVIQGFYKAHDEQGYKIEQKGGSRVHNCPRGRVILNTEQADIFLALQASSSNDKTNKNSSMDTQSSSPRTRSADRAPGGKASHTQAWKGPSDKFKKILQNSGEKAARTLRSSGEKAACVSQISNNSSCTSHTTNKKVTKPKGSCIQSPEKGIVQASPKNKKSDEEPTRKSVRKSRKISSSETPKSSHKSSRKHESIHPENHGDKSGKVGTHVSNVRRRLSTAMQTESENKRLVATETFSKKLQAEVPNVDIVLPTNHDLFRGYGFVITGSDNCVSHDDENSPTEDDHNFNRKQVRQQIEVGGGVILPTFPDDATSDKSYLLLSNSSQTTAKYFYALVVGVPCLSHVWVRDCCLGNKLISYNNYLLPAGNNLITGKLVEEQKCSNALRDTKLYLVGDEEFKIQWKKVLRAAGCEIVTKLPANVLRELQYGNEDFECDVIVVGNGQISHSTIRKARLLGVPTVTIHWLKQCILTGKRVHYNAHSSFSYRVEGEQ